MGPITLAIFDLDHTLISLDSSAAWWGFMQELGWVSDPAAQHRHAELMQQYDEGLLDMRDYLKLTLAPLKGRAVGDVERLAQQFVHQRLLHALLPGARALIERHRAAGHHLVLNSASEYFVVEPWGTFLGFDTVFGVPVQQREGLYTGCPEVDITYREGKVLTVQRWLAQEGLAVADCYAYSDSHNDLPLLEFASHPCAVNPNELLRAEAEARGWPVMSLTPTASAPESLVSHG
ncbi:HAD-IB family hydrolase [Salinispirillum sp. LH 10-3-1]|uniref:HAD-IB family hydrolase n=1 Tax=Salinispirillum sp. LH 10-3-1 TaxID=2952525 RepID=A0AB38YIP6_9GAMM